jgi:PadR family transcriptional regulator, regulatory protein PadR
MGKPRMTLHSLVVLKVFANDPLDEHYGLEICRAAGLPGGTIYPILARFEQAGWLTSIWEQIDPVAAGRRPRRLYRLTPSGAEQARQALTEAQQTLFTPPVPGPRPEPA